jgi:DNA (cytosine-5)-methyltransferase 1
MRVGSLFAGIGGFDIAARWMGWRTAWVSEIEPFACRVLAHHFPDAPNHGDITTIDFTTVEPVDVLVGGFPCQDISNAGEQEGITGARSGLWFEYARAIRELRPRYVVVENVAALTNRGLDAVLGSLAEIGYDAEWGCFGAADVGAPHKRDRLWLLAYPQRGSESVAYASGSRREGWVYRWENTQREGVMGHLGRSGAVHEQPRQDWWATEPTMGRVAHGVSGRVAQLKGLGNAIVPQCVMVIYHLIAERERCMISENA